MASFMNKALAYLGLKDLDDDLYDDEDYDAEPPRERARTVYPEREPEEVPPEPRSFGGTVRPLANNEEVGFGRTGSTVLRPVSPSRSAKVHVVAPERFSEAQEIGDVMRQANPVIVNLTLADRDLARRMIDFCSGLTYALNGAMDRVADHVFLLTPPNVEVSAEERQRLQERGLLEP
ncbi:MAG TPA: cell division protein SepF [Acidimicrobiales bacterium]|nr:cell division protein SepF [Acidimicrobiales bacterium]